MSPSPGAIVLFEDEAAQTLEPLSLTRPVWELRCGICTLGQKIKDAFPKADIYHCARSYLAGIFERPFSAENSGNRDLLWINGSLIAGQGLSKANELKVGSAWISGGRVMAFRREPPEGWKAGTELSGNGFHKVEAPSDAGQLVRYLWELVGTMNGEIAREARELRPLGEMRGDSHKSAVLIRDEEIFVGKHCHLGPGAVLDATQGPVVLDEAVIIEANAVVEGPTYLGPGTQVKPMTHIRGSCLGEQCRAGGEITVSIIQGFTNKQHGGFLGHSYIGSWCNLGSGTETSNLKNNYTNVKVQVGSQLVDSGQLFVGLFMGDHSKSAIGSVFNTGTVVGVGCMIVGAGFPPRLVPSFHWGGADKLTLYPLKRTMETTRAMMARRDRELSQGEVDVLSWIHRNRTSQTKVKIESTG